MRLPGSWVLGATIFAVVAGWGTARAQGTAAPAQSSSPSGAAAPDGVTQAPPTDEKPDPRKRRLSDTEKFTQQKELKQELHGVYKTWLDEDVRWIITPTEEEAFKKLSNDEERDAFIEDFWQRRNPNPDSPDNEFREEHYARIAYANENFAAGKPGWMTDRGHIYIAYGKADEIERHPSGGNYERPLDEGGGETSTFPFEVWHYRYIEGIGDNIDLEFVDTCQCGEYRYTIDRSEKDALKKVPNAGLTMYEQNGQANKADRSGNGIEELGLGPLATQNKDKEFDRLALSAKIMAPPPVKYQDMDEFMTNAKILSGPPLLFDVRTDYVKVTNDMVYVPITISVKNSDITFNTKDGVSEAKVDIEGRISNLTHKVVLNGWFGDPVEVPTPSELLPAVQKGTSLYWKEIPLRPGLYKIDVVMKDQNNPDHVGHWTRSINVPKFDDDTLAHSSLILADIMEHVPSKEIGGGNFVLGDTRVRPRVSEGPSVPVTFSRAQNLNFWMQVYNLGIDEKSKLNNATIEYQIVNLATNKPVLDTQESTQGSSTKLSRNADQLTLEKTMALSSLQPGQYQVTIKVNDLVTKQQTQESAKFTLN